LEEADKEIGKEVNSLEMEKVRNERKVVGKEERMRIKKGAGRSQNTGKRRIMVANRQTNKWIIDVDGFMQII
jgi:hypothetical protein